MSRNRSLTLEERARQSATKRFTFGSSEWQMAYNEFVATNGSKVKQKSPYRNVTRTAAIFASHHAKGLKGTPIWKAFFSNYVEKCLLIEKVKILRQSSQKIKLDKSYFCTNCNEYRDYIDEKWDIVDNFEIGYAFCAVCGADMLLRTTKFDK